MSVVDHTAPTDRERIVHAGGVDLCVETFGDPSAPPLLLVAGAACSMLYWAEKFCERLAAGHRFVIRYDIRDTGRRSRERPADRSVRLHPRPNAHRVTTALDPVRVERADHRCCPTLGPSSGRR